MEKILKSAEKVDVNERSTEGFAPLCIAAFWGYAEIVKMLLEHGWVDHSRYVHVMLIAISIHMP